MLNFIKKYNLLSLIIIVIIGVYLWFNNFVVPKNTIINYNSLLMPFSSFWFTLFNSNIYFSEFIAFAFIAIQAGYIYYLNKKYIFLDSQTYLHVLIFILIININNNLQHFQPIIIANLFLLFAYNKVFDAYKKNNAFKEYFEASALISIGSLFYFNLIFFMPAIWIAMLILTSFNIREWIVSILGIIVPYLILLSIYFLFNKTNIFIDKIYYNVNTTFIKTNWNIFYIIIYSFIIIITIISVLHLFAGNNIRKIKNRKFFQVFAWVLPVVFIIWILKLAKLADLFFLLSLPITFILTGYFFIIKSKWLKEVLFILIVLMIFSIQFIK